jgi:hypothetical protein
MGFTIAIPSHMQYAPLVARAQEVAQRTAARLLIGSEQECEQWFSRHNAEIALLTPLAYAREALKADLRIIPATALSLDGLTYTGSIYVKRNTTTIERCASPNADNFLMIIGAAMLREKFDVELTLVQKNGSVSELLDEFDAVIDYGFDDTQEVVLDISDEWSDYVGERLPVALWVCRLEEIPEKVSAEIIKDIIEIVTACAAENLPPETDIAEREHNGANAGRTGVVSTRWDNDLEESLQRTLELLFYLQYAPAIAATKVWQRT